MMINIVNFIAILTFLVSLRGCKIFKDQHGTWVADCHATGIKKISTDLGPLIEVLDISSNNKIVTLHKDDLEGYPKLWGLIMANLFVTSFPEGFFRNTPMLRMLNISNTQIKNFTEIPASITVLNFTFSNSEYVNLSHLSNLEELLLRGSSNMKTIPHMNKSAPLQVLDMRFASLIHGNYTQIASFCRLRYFGLESDELNQDKHTIQCCGFRLWCHHHSVIKHGWQRQNCSLQHGKTCEQIGINFSEEAVTAFYECDIVLKRAFLVKLAVKIIVSCIITLMVFGAPLSFLLHRYYEKKMSSVRGIKESIPSEETVSLEDEIDAEADQDDND